MKIRSRNSRLSLSVLTLFLLLFLGCSSQIKSVSRTDQKIVWPPPPEIPRIQFLYSFSSPEELKIKDGFLNRLFGKSKKEQLRQPVASVIGNNGTIYVADFTGTLYSFDATSGVFRAQERTKKGKLHSPVSLTVGENDSLYVIDPLLNQLIIYNQKLDPVREIPLSLERPSAIVWDRQRQGLFIADAAKHNIGFFDLSGKCLYQFGNSGRKDDGFNTPTHLFLAGDTLFVTDALNFRIKLFQKNGTFLKSIGKLGSCAGSFARPKGVAVNSEGHLFVVDALFGNVQIYDTTGNLLLFFGESGRGEIGKFSLPSGIFIDVHDRIYIADSHNGRIQVFQYLSAAKSESTKQDLK